MSHVKKDTQINIALKLLMAILFMTGAFIFSYPFIVDAINNFYDQRMLMKLSKENEQHFDLEKEKIAQMKRENQELNKEKKMKNVPGMGLVEDPFEEIDAQETLGKQVDRQAHLLGSIYIPAINVGLPLFDETNNELLEIGATLLQGTSYPIGGENTHSVITGHSGLPKKKLFTDLEKVTKGDRIYIEISNETLAYKVQQIKKVLPTEVDDLVIKEGEDLITLVTCTPYMVNTHRLLVTANRTVYQEAVAVKEKRRVSNYHTFRLVLFIIGGSFFLVIFFYWSRKKWQVYTKIKKRRFQKR